MYPDADSMLFIEHIRLGEALRPLNDAGVLRACGFFSQFAGCPNAESRAANEAFEQWLIATCGDAELSESERQRRLSEWSLAPGASFCHPREEHLLPLHVCYGYAGAASNRCYTAMVMNYQASMFYWEQ